MKECVKSDPNTYQYATLNLKKSVDLIILFSNEVVHFLQ